MPVRMHRWLWHGKLKARFKGTWFQLVFSSLLFFSHTHTRPVGSTRLLPVFFLFFFNLWAVISIAPAVLVNMKYYTQGSSACLPSSQRWHFLLGSMLLRHCCPLVVDLRTAERGWRCQLPARHQNVNSEYSMCTFPGKLFHCLVQNCHPTNELTKEYSNNTLGFWFWLYLAFCLVLIYQSLQVGNSVF